MPKPRKRPEDKQKPGRVPKFEKDPDLIRRICENLELGMPITLAAECEGVSRSTILDWVAKKKSNIFGRVTRARAAGAKNLIVRSLAGGPGSREATWHLERRYREDYGIPKVDPLVELGEVKIVIEGGLPRRPVK